MTSLRFVALSTETIDAFQKGAVDANGHLPERHISAGDGVPCRHCLQDVPEGQPFLVLAYRPFPEPQPYAEVGPIFLHADPCPRYPETSDLPPIALERERFLIRGYSADNRIVYGTGQMVETTTLTEAAAQLLARPEVAYIHMRSATNSCYQCRIEREQ